MGKLIAFGKIIGKDFKALESGLRIPTKQGLITLHDSVINASKQTKDVVHYGIRDESVLEQLCSKLEIHKYKGDKDRLRDIYHIGTEIFYHVVYHVVCRHPFTDGNKRTAYIAALFFIGFNLRGQYGARAVVHLKLEDTDKVIEEIAKWGQDTDISRLKKLIQESGVIGKKAREINDQDVKNYINAFLRHNIRIEGV